MKNAIFETCAGVINDGEYAHGQRDFCTICAPYWERYPACPDCKTMLGGKKAREGDRRKCPKCKTMVLVGKDDKK